MYGCLCCFSLSSRENMLAQSLSPLSTARPQGKSWYRYARTSSFHACSGFSVSPCEENDGYGWSGCLSASLAGFFYKRIGNFVDLFVSKSICVTTLYLKLSLLLAFSLFISIDYPISSICLGGHSRRRLSRHRVSWDRAHSNRTGST